MTAAQQRLAKAGGVAILLAPCFWQSRIHAGDLSSHIYNAWLATLIEKGQAPGLVIKPMFTNVSFDVLLETLFKWFGADWAQRLAAALVVLVFASGVFAFLHAVSRKPAWFLFPVVAMLSYGTIFHLGFLNYLLSLGFSLMALSLLMRPTRRSVAAACILLVFGFTAHFVPPLWAAALAAYRWAMRRVRPRWTPLLLACSLGALVALHWFLRSHSLANWPPWQQDLALDVNPFWISADWTKVFLVPVLTVWGLLFLHLLKAKSLPRILLGFPAQCLLLNAAATLLLPDALFLPGYPAGFSLIRTRLSLLAAIAVCALVASARPRLLEVAVAAAAGCAFFAVLYADNRGFNRFEDKLARVVQTLPQGSLVVAPLHNRGRIDQGVHMIDRECIGRCFSYANYEPLSNHFRIRLNGASPLVAPNNAASLALQNGAYVPPRGSPSYYQINLCPGTQDLCVRLVGPETWSTE